ncbi:hypothetical protein H4Q26_002347 [Puccinia striiformis f. sp. tritici PST-130]|nr:hypothetical protein H4Q26_002342 [Puccinia striiformis f. sp. tritici PST-130]KAI9603037.1 hypothetical protein H4Q26_002347 [Puccinia striiformis f. sp. tritici PST-130]
MQSLNSIFMVLAIVCGLAVAASDQPKCAKTACEYFDQSRGETRLTLTRSHCPPTKKWCCPDIVSRGLQATITSIDLQAPLFLQDGESKNIGRLQQVPWLRAYRHQLRL